MSAPPPPQLQKSLEQHLQYSLGQLMHLSIKAKEAVYRKKWLE